MTQDVRIYHEVDVLIIGKDYFPMDAYEAGERMLAETDLLKYNGSSGSGFHQRDLQLQFDTAAEAEAAQRIVRKWFEDNGYNLEHDGDEKPGDVSVGVGGYIWSGLDEDDIRWLDYLY
jgi:hypothetical protein